MNLFQVQLLYYIASTITVFSLSIYTGVALVHANRKRLRHIQTWLFPFFIGDVFTMLEILAQDYHFFTSTRASLPEYSLLAAVPPITGLLGIYGMVRLNKIISITLPSASETFEGIKPNPTEDKPWPPPPDKPPI